jgi:DUF1680 family protein
MGNRMKISRREFVAGALVAATTAALPKSAKALTGPYWKNAPAVAASARAQAQARKPIKERTEFLAEPFPMEQVRLLDGPFLAAQKANYDYLTMLPEERLVHNFRVTAGLPSSAEPLGGWESPNVELRGHFTGHYLSAAALLHASTGDAAIKAKGDAIVADLAKCQEKFGNGYLSAFPESFFDRLQEGRGVWAPFYTLHKIMAGCIDMYTYCGNEQALELADGMGRWTAHWTTGISDALMQRILKTEFGGMEESLLNLGAITGNWRDFGTARRFEKPWFFDPLAEHRDELKGLHVNTHIPQVIGAARRYELTGEPHYHEVASYFWNEVTHERSYATGGTSNGEDWDTDAGDLSKALSLWSEECCCGFNMLKLTRHLYQWTADPRYFDYYERTLLNSRLGTQHPENGRKMYYLPLETGFFKFYNSDYNSFWCCTGTGAEEFGKFNDSIYFHNDRDVFVNLFIASEVNWPEKNLTIRQETKFPEQEGTALVVKATKPVEAGINIRIPAWADAGGSVLLNGKPLEAWSNPGSYLEIRRKWADGDKLEVKLPMHLHTEPLPGDPTQRAAMYGPLVLAAKLGTADLPKEAIYDADHGETQLAPPHAKPEGTANATVKSNGRGAEADWVEAVSGQTLTFQTVGQNEKATLVPLNQIYDERYGVYWKVTSPSRQFQGA